MLRGKKESTIVQNLWEALLKVKLIFCCCCLVRKHTGIFIAKLFRSNLNVLKKENGYLPNWVIWWYTIFFDPQKEQPYMGHSVCGHSKVQFIYKIITGVTGIIMEDF